MKAVGLTSRPRRRESRGLHRDKKGLIQIQASPEWPVLDCLRLTRACTFECYISFNLFSFMDARRPCSSQAIRFHFNLYLSARYDCAVCGPCCCYIYYYIFIGMLLYELADIYRVSEHYSVCS